MVANIAGIGKFRKCAGALECCCGGVCLGRCWVVVVGSTVARRVVHHFFASTFCTHDERLRLSRSNTGYEHLPIARCPRCAHNASIRLSCGALERAVTVCNPCCSCNLRPQPLRCDPSLCNNIFFTCHAKCCRCYAPATYSSVPTNRWVR